jgi:hypothetical protein
MLLRPKLISTEMMKAVSIFFQSWIFIVQEVATPDLEVGTAATFRHSVRQRGKFPV